MRMNLPTSFVLASTACLSLAASAAGQVPEKRGETPLLVPAPENAGAKFAAPVLVQAGGAPIDVGPQIGYAGPTLHDADGDGRLDLYVGCFQGKILFAQNIGTTGKPAFAKPKWMQAEGQDIAISNW